MTCLLQHEKSAHSSLTPNPQPLTPFPQLAPSGSRLPTSDFSSPLSLADLTHEKTQQLLLSKQFESHRNLRTQLLQEQARLFAHAHLAMSIQRLRKLAESENPTVARLACNQLLQYAGLPAPNYRNPPSAFPLNLNSDLNLNPSLPPPNAHRHVLIGNGQSEIGNPPSTCYASASPLPIPAPSGILPPSSPVRQTPIEGGRMQRFFKWIKLTIAAFSLAAIPALASLAAVPTPPAPLQSTRPAPPAPTTNRAQPLEALLEDAFPYRNLGPFRAGSWIADIAVPDSPPQSHLYTFYIAPRNGGIWKTTNNGTTFTPLFNDQPTLSMGAIAVAPSNENILFVGTGDASCARSATRGIGLFKSTDAGKTWQFSGLPDSHHIARILIHPTNPDIVYVAAMGHLYSANEERGVYKTTDGGKSWSRVLFLNSRTGVIDLVINRNDPNTLYAATYELMRDPWRIVDGGPSSGIQKTTDGGASWKKCETGLPTGTIGRIGLDLYQKNPNTLYAVVDNRNPSNAPARAGRGGGTAAPQLIGGECYRSDDAGSTWKKTNAAQDDLSRKSGYAFNQLRIDPNNPDKLFITGSSFATSEDGGKTWAGLGGGGGGGGVAATRTPFRRAFGDFRTLWIDPQNSNRMIAGSDGGVALSYDAGATCDYLTNLTCGEVYALTTDMDEPYHIYAGLQDHESWKGPSNGWTGNVVIDDWSTVGIGDGMYNQVDPIDSRWVYNTQEFGRHARFDQQTRIRTTITPPADIGGEGVRLRYNWVAPFRISPHDPKTLYAGAQFLLRTKDRGDTWERISPDLTTNDPTKISPPSAAIQHCTITTIAESPAKSGVIWVGTDDGKVQVTQDNGGKWSDVTPNLSAATAPEDAWVTRVCPSPTVPGTAYVAKNRFRQDDFRPFLFKTTDFGATWTAIHGNLPPFALHVVFEDYKNPNLLFVGSDDGVYVSVDGGGFWSHLKANMPSVPVTDLTIHPRDGDLVAGTFGRGIWVTNITPLRELTNDVVAKEAFFFTTYQRAPQREGALGNYRLYGDRFASTPNAPSGPVFTYYLKDAAAATQRITITITDGNGATVRTLNGTGRAGINRVTWTGAGGAGGRGGAGRGAAAATPPARGDVATAPAGATQPAAPARGNAGEGPAGFGRGGAAALAPGDYTVTLHVGDKTFSHKAHLSFSPSTDLGGDGEEENEGENDEENEG